MTTPLQPSSRDGLKTLISLAKALCRIVAASAPLILKNYPDNTTIQNLIAAIVALCPLVTDVETELQFLQGDNQPALDDPDSLPGIDITASPAEEPDYNPA